MTPLANRRSTSSPRSTLARALSTLAVPALVGTASATVSTTLVADTYNVTDGTKIYSVLDVYVSSNALGDAMSSVLGLSGTTSFPVVFATSLATGTGLTRDADGRITAGTITSDAFVQAGSSSWLPTFTGAGTEWDSFITLGGRKQGASVTNRAGVKKVYDATTIQGGAGFTQLSVANSSFIPNGGTSGWFSSLGANCYASAGTSELPFVRCSLYNATWNAAYPDLDRAGRLLTLGRRQTGRGSAGASPVFTGEVGTSLDFCFMVGRFTVDVTSISEFTPPTMQVQFNMVGKNGTGNETGTTFTGATNAIYRVSQFFTFAVPSRIPPSPTGVIATDGTDVNRVQLTWPAVVGATSYEIWRATSGGGATLIGTSLTNAFDDTTAVPATLYSYQLKSVNGIGTSGFSSVETGWRGLPIATGIAAGDGASSAGVTVNWNAVSGATGYRVLRGPVGGPLASIGTVTVPPYVDSTAVPGKLYTYGVSALSALGDSPAGNDNGYRLMLPPASLSASDGTEGSGVVLNWAASNGALGYKVFRGVATADTLIATLGVTTTYTDTSAVPGAVYLYAVRAVGDGTPDTALSPTDAGSRSLPAPLGLVASGGTSLDGVVLGWAPIPGIGSYAVYRSQGAGASTKIGTPAANAFTDTTALPGQLYAYAVRAVAGAGEGPSTDPVSGWRGISAPAAVNATDGASAANVVVTWSAAAGAASYKVFRGEGSPSTQIGTVTAPTTTFTDTSANPGVLYAYAVRGAGMPGTGDGVLSAPNTGYRALSAPTGLNASDGTSGTGITLTWTGAAGAAGYRVMRATLDGVPAQVATPAGTSYVDNGVAAGVVYRYSIITRGATGIVDSPPSATDTGWRAVAVPSALVASDGTSTSGVSLTWTGSAGTSFRVFRAVGGGTPESIGTSSEPAFTDTTATPGRVFTYTVKGISPGGDTEASGSNTGWRRLLPPTALSAADGASTEGINLTWSLPTGAVTAVKLFRSTGGNPAQPLATLGGDATTFNDTTAAPGTPYTYTARASGETGTGDSESSISNEGWRGLLPPLGLTASDGTSSTAVNVSWSGSLGAATYTILRSSGGAVATAIASVSAPAATYADTSAEASVLYTYSVRANGSAGTGSSVPSLSDTGWRAPTAPTGVMASDGTSTSDVVISWVGVQGASSYKVFRGTTGAAATLLGSAGSESFTDTTALPGVLYTYVVRATIGSADTRPSLPDTGWRNMLAPTGVAATDGSRLTDVQVAWRSTTGAVSYKVLRATGDGAPTVIGTVAASTLSYTDASAVPGTLYRYAVRATGAVGTGDSEPSASDTGWRMLSAPSALSASDGTNTSQVTLTWVASAGAVSYKVFRSGTAEPIGTSATNGHADTTAVAGVRYSYTVRAVGGSGTGESAASSADAGWRGLAAPAGLAASDGSSTAHVSVTWSAVPGAASYRLLRAAPGATAGVIASPTGTSVLDTSAAPGVRYTYSVQAMGSAGAGVISSTDTGWRNLLAPTGLKASDGTSATAVIVSWNASTGAAGYKVLRSEGGADPTTVGTTRAGVLTFSDVSAVPGTVYAYSVRALGNAGTGESASSATDTGFRGGSSGGPSGLISLGGGMQGPQNTDSGGDPLAAVPMGLERYLLAAECMPEAAVTCAAAEAESAAEPAALAGGGTLAVTAETHALASEETMAEPFGEVPSTDAVPNVVGDEPATQDAVTDPPFIDLDANGEPDLCQLRRGDLDLNGQIDEHDVSRLLLMYGEAPTLGIGDLDHDGFVGAADLALLSALLSAPQAPVVSN